MHQENEPSKLYFGKCKLNYFGKFKTRSNGKEIYAGETTFSYFGNINGQVIVI